MTSKDEFSDMDIQLELKERLNYAYILQATLLSLKRLLVSPYDTSNDVQRLIRDFFADIPRSWYDEDFIEDIRECVKLVQTDVRPEFCGEKLSIEHCKKNNIPIFSNKPQIDYFRLKNAIINLLDRLNMLIRKEKIEMSTGRNLKYESLDELIDEMDIEELTNE